MSTAGREGSEGSVDVAPPDPAQLMRSRQYRRLLLVSSLIGVLVSFASWGFLELVHALQVGVYTDLPGALGFESSPWWWPLPVLALAGVLIALAVTRLPGNGGHEPSEGLHTGAPTTAVELPGVLLAATATIALGMVLGPEAPLIALGSGLAMFVLDQARRPVSDQGRAVIAAAAAFAALATIFGSPVIGAVIIIEAAGLGGPTLPMILLPGLLASGIGSLVFVGLGSFTGLSSEDYALPPLSLPAYPTARVADFVWVVGLAVVTALVVFLVMRLAGAVRDLVARRPLVLIPAACLVVGVVAIVFAETSGQPVDAVLFSGQDAMSGVLKQADSTSVGVLTLLLVCKAVAWGVSMGAARGGPTFPGIFVGLVMGLLCTHLPGFAESPAVGALIGAAVVSVLRLPLSAIVLALLIAEGEAALAPLVIVGVVVAYIATLALAGRRERVAPAGVSRE